MMFVVNLYENRSDRWKEKRSLEMDNFDTIQIIVENDTIQDHSVEDWLLGESIDDSLFFVRSIPELRSNRM